MNKQTLYYTIGLPASGKDTKANEMIDKAQGKLKRVNKDSLRLLIDNNKWSKEREKNIVKSRDVLIKLWLQQGYDVICTDTNLAPVHEQSFKDLVEEMNAEINVKLEKIDLTDVSITTCIERDLQRENPVGKKVISDMYFRYLFDKEAWTKPVKEIDPNAIIVDIDGCMAIHQGRSPYDLRKVSTDGFNYNLWFLIKDKNIIFLSGRESTEQCRTDTISWLKKHTKIENEEFYSSRLFMRKEGDHRKDYIVKNEIYERDILPHYNVILAIDDRDSIVDLWRSKGILTLQTNYGGF